MTANPRPPRDMVALARCVDDLGLDGLGISDSPHLHGAMFPVVQHLLQETLRIAIGPFVTNPVTRHTSVLAADLDAIESLYPGRLFCGIGTGDSAVTSVGLRAAPAQAVAATTAAVVARLGSRVPVLMATGGLRAAAHVPPTATGVVLGGGVDRDWSAQLVAAAQRSAGRELERWGFLIASLGPEAETREREREVLGSVTTVARHALAADPAGRGVPAPLVAGLERIFDAYDVTYHGRTDSPVHRALEQLPEHRRYLLDRFAVTQVDAPTVDRLRAMATDLGLTGLYLSSTVADPLQHTRYVASELAPALDH